jgi:hypothetical protein
MNKNALALLHLVDNSHVDACWCGATGAELTPPNIGIRCRICEGERAQHRRSVGAVARHEMQPSSLFEVGVRMQVACFRRRSGPCGDDWPHVINCSALLITALLSMVMTLGVEAL